MPDGIASDLVTSIKKSGREGLACQSIYDGRTKLGDIVERLHGFEAMLPDGRSLGLFNDVEAAVHALISNRRPSP
jgi:hypothetical protein